MDLRVYFEHDYNGGSGENPGVGVQFWCYFDQYACVVILALCQSPGCTVQYLTEV